MRVVPLLIAAGLLGAPAHAAEVSIDAFSVIPIHGGVNTIPRFSQDGRPATIVQAWRDNGNAHGHYAYMVLLSPKRGEGWGDAPGVTPFEGSGESDTLGVSPFDGERVLQTVRFARARVGGEPATVAIVASLGEAPSGVLADHAPVDIRIYALRHLGLEVGATPDVFQLAKKLKPAGAYCNADMALHTALGLPLPSDYAGARARGCLD